MSRMWKRNDDYQLHIVGEEAIIVPIGEATKHFNGMIRLNKSGAFLWEQLAENCSEEKLVQALLVKYEIVETVAIECVTNYIKKLSERNFIEFVQERCYEII